MDAEKALNDLFAFPMPFGTKKVRRVEAVMEEYPGSSTDYCRVDIRFSDASRGMSSEGSMRFEGKTMLEVLEKAKIFMSLL